MGTNDLKQHTYGSGEVHFGQFAAGTQVHNGFRYLGNTPDFSLSISTERLDHMDADHGVKEKDDSILISTAMSGTIVTDNINRENVALLLTGSSSIISQGSASGQTFTVNACTFGTYQIGATSTNPTGAFKITVSAVTDGASGTPNPWVAGTDYVLDLDRGQITILQGGTIEEGDKVVVTYAKTAATRSHIVADNNTVEGAILFKAYNPKGPVIDYLFPYVQLVPDGDFSLKGDDWQTITYGIDVLRLGSLARVYANGIVAA